MVEKNRQGKTYNLGRKVRSPQKKEEFVPYIEPIRGTKAHCMYTTVEREGTEQLTLYGYYSANLLDIQNERKLEVATCKNYDNVVCTLIAPAFAGYALKEMDEMDFLACWKNVLKRADSVVKVDEAYSLIRMIAAYAYQHGDTDVSLWGLMPEDRFEYFVETRQKEPEVKGESQEIKHYADRGIRIGRSISLTTEFKLYLRMLQQSTSFGQVLAGLILFTTGCRTSEAVAFKFQHLTEMFPGCWALQRINVSHPDARDSEIGGKTHNAFRMLWIPGFLAKLILDKREYLLNNYPEIEVNELTIACYGVDYQRPCTQKELNAHMKELFREVGVKEDMVASAFREICESKSNMEEYERSAVAYLGRHQAITAMVYCGLSEAQICVCAGHEQIDREVEAYDFVNPDTFRELANVLGRRPIIQILDQMAQYDEILYEGGANVFSSDGWSRVVFPSDREIEFLLCVYGMKGNVEVELGHVEGVEILGQMNLRMPRQKEGEGLSIRHALRTAGEEAYLEAKNELEESATAGPAVNDLDWIEGIADEKIQIYEVKEAEVAELPDVGTLLPRTIATVEETGSLKTAGKKQEGNLTARGISAQTSSAADQYVASAAQLYVLSRTGELVNLDAGQQKIFQRGARGKKVLSGQHAVALYAYNPAAPACLISREGRIYRVPAGGIQGTGGTAYHDVLRNRGVLLQGAALEQAGSSLICVTSVGTIVRLAVNCLSGSFPEEGRVLLDQEAMCTARAEVVSACICPEKTDVLLVTQNGQALRIADKDFKVCKSFSLKPIKGISLEEGDRAVACLPYTDVGVFSITTDGRGVLFREKTELSPHGRGSKGVALVKLCEGDRIVAAMTPGVVVGMLRKDGYLCCTETSSFPEYGRGRMGVRAMNTTRDSPVVAGGVISPSD